MISLWGRNNSEFYFKRKTYIVIYTNIETSLLLIKLSNSLLEIMTIFFIDSVTEYSTRRSIQRIK